MNRPSGLLRHGRTFLMERIEMIELRDVAVTFGHGSNELHAVVDATLKIYKGEIVGIVGYSGAGKALWFGPLTC